MGDEAADAYGDAMPPTLPADDVSGPGPGEVVTALIRACEARDLDAVELLVADDIVYDNVPIGVVHGPAGVRRVLSGGVTAAATAGDTARPSRPTAVRPTSDRRTVRREAGTVRAGVGDMGDLSGRVT